MQARPVEQCRVYSIYYYGTLTLPYKRRGERAVEAVAVRVDSGREQETFFISHTLQVSIYTTSSAVAPPQEQAPGKKPDGKPPSKKN